MHKYSIEDFSSVEALNAARRRNKDVTLDDAAALAARGGAIHEVGAKEDAVGEVKFGSTNLSRIHISATTPNIADIERIEAGAGRYFQKAKTRRAATSPSSAPTWPTNCFPTANPLGQTIRIDGRPFEVIGVGKAKGSVFGQPQDMYVSMPLSTFLAIYGSRRSISLSVTSTSPADLPGRGRRSARRDAHAPQACAEREGQLRHHHAERDQRTARQDLRHDSDRGDWRDFDFAGGRRHRDHEHHAGLA